MEKDKKQKKPKRDYKKENEIAKKNNIRLNIKVPKKYGYTLEDIKKNEGVTGFFIESLKNYNRKELILTTDETAGLMAIIENYLLKNQNLDGKYLEQVKQLENKVRKYYDDIFS